MVEGKLIQQSIRVMFMLDYLIYSYSIQNCCCTLLQRTVSMMYFYWMTRCIPASVTDCCSWWFRCCWCSLCLLTKLIYPSIFTCFYRKRSTANMAPYAPRWEELPHCCMRPLATMHGTQFLRESGMQHCQGLERGDGESGMLLRLVRWRLS